MLNIKSIFLAFILFLSAPNIFAQQTGSRILLKGKVVDKKHHITLPGVTVKVGADATSTDKNGDFVLTASLNTLTEKGLTFSCIGYLNVRFIYEPNHYYEVELTENNTQLKEIVIGAGDDIIKKAIKRIPQNYPQKPIVIKGMLRTQTWRNKSEYFKSDAVIKAYVPPYDDGEKTTVTVLQNHIDTAYDKTLRYIRHVSNYNVVDFQDIVHNRYILNLILKKRKFDYLLIGKQMYDDHKVFVINSTLKDTGKTYDKIDVTLYIDTATYAFAAANVSIYNWRQLGFLPIKKQIFRVTYQKIGKKWYLAETHAAHTAEYKTQSPESTVDFIRTEIDSVNVERIPYKDIIQHMDDIFLIKKATSNAEWASNTTLFKEAETEGKMAIVSTTLLDTIKHNNVISNPPGKKVKEPFMNLVYKYLTTSVRASYSAMKMPVEISSTGDALTGGADYGWGVQGDYRLYKWLFFSNSAYQNFGSNKHVGLDTHTYNLSGEFIFNKNARHIILTPYAGYEGIEASYQKTKINYDTFDYGVRIAFERSHRYAYYISFGGNTATGTKSIYELNFAPTNYEIGIGFVLRP